MRAAIERFFRLREHGTTMRIEVLGGITTFAATAYIIVLNPAILANAGLPTGPSTVATILAALFGTLLMGLYANRPIAVAPYMGENAFIAFGLVISLGYPWQVCLGAVMISGVVFLILTVFGVRSWLANAISPSMKYAFVVGIGLFLAFLGLNQSQIVVSGQPAVPVKLGNLRETTVRLAVGGFLLTAILLCWRVKGALLIGIVATAVAGYALGVGKRPDAIAAIPFVGQYDLSPIAFQLDVVGALQLSFLPVLLTLFVMSFLDTLGTLVGLGAAANLLDEQGNFPEVEKPMMVDAAACMFAAAVGTSTTGAYIESAAGIRDGARTGLAAVTTALLFAVALFFIPLAQPLQDLSYAYGPALVAVGAMMLSASRKIEFDDITESLPAFVTIVLIVFTFNIANGLTAGLIIYPILKLVSGRARELSAGAIVLALACLVYYVFGLPH